MLQDAVGQVLDLYPRVFFACHTRHVRDPEARRTLSAHQASILDHLDDVTPTSLKGLARHMGVTASTMSLAVARLVRDGYVSREVDPFDRRRVSLRLSDAGVRIKEARSVLEPDRLRAVLALLTPDERDHAVRGLALLARACGDYMHAQPQRAHAVGAAADRAQHGGPARRTP